MTDLPEGAEERTHRSARPAVIGALAERLAGIATDHPLRVAVDGVTASGKTTLASELAVALERLGRPVVRVSMDGYHHRRDVRYRRGRRSADGYYEDAYDVEALARYVLDPLGPGGDRRYRPRVIDLAADRPIEAEPASAPADAFVLVDGSFLQRPPLRERWDVRIFVDTSLPEARRRGVARDAGLLGGVDRAAELFDERYHAAARRYVAEHQPARRADFRVENDDLARPVLHDQRPWP